MLSASLNKTFLSLSLYKKEGYVLINDALNTFYLRLYGVGRMVKNHWDNERGNPLPPVRGLHFPISCKGSFIFYNSLSHRQDSTYYNLCYASRGALDGMKNMANL